MAVRDDFAPGEVLAAADLNDTFDDLRDGLASKADYPSGGSDNNVLVKSGTSAAWSSIFVPAAGLQQIRFGTDSSARITTSATLVDANLSVPITPKFSDSRIFIFAFVLAEITRSGESAEGRFAITDSSDNTLNGQSLLRYDAQEPDSDAMLLRSNQVFWASNTPATTSEVTYKLRFRQNATGTTVTCKNDSYPALMIALERKA